MSDQQMKGFIKDYSLVQETSRVDDLLDFSVLASAFKKKIDGISSTATVGLVGRFGTGKSTMLYQLAKSAGDTENWIIFDAWKYPERRDLWEGFVLDFADQVGDKKKVLSKIEGKSTKSKFLDVATDVLGEIVDKLPKLDFLDKFTEIFKQSPATRVFQIQEILMKLIASIKEPRIFIVVEDVDRSGDSGVYFLETLKQFLRDSKIEKTIIVVVPMGDDNYYKNFDSYMKSLDYVEFFQPIGFGLQRFVEETIDESLFAGEAKKQNNQIIWTGPCRKTQVISFLEALFHKEPSMSMRTLKLILRKADLAYQSQQLDDLDPDFRVTLCIEASKFFQANANSKDTYFDLFKKNQIIGSTTIFASFLAAILGNATSIYRETGEKKKELLGVRYDFKFSERQGNNGKIQYPSYPWLYSDHFGNGDGFALCDFYLNY